VDNLAKWADYLISEVSYHDNRDYISQLKVHIDNGETVSSSSIWDKDKVVNYIENGYSFCTIYRDNGKWSKGSEVVVIVVDGEKFLRTDANKKKQDNLEELPEF
jgi:hypothetical protein